MLAWLCAAPLSAALLVMLLQTVLSSLTPSRPIAAVSMVVVPMLHIALTFTVATLMGLRPSVINDLSQPQRFVAVWTDARLLVPIGGLQIAVLGLVALLDQRFCRRSPSLPN